MNPNTLSRRLFLQRLIAGSAVLAGSSILPVQAPLAAPADPPKTLVNLMLYGGADLRFVFAPDPLTADSNYINQYWQARRALYGDYADYAAMYAGEYTSVTKAFTFGIHKSCGWLITQFNNDNAAIIANTYGSLNRRHDHSQLIVESGDLLASRTFVDRDGWGGRVVESLNDTPNVLELSSNVQTFCKGTDSTFRLAQVIHAQNTRDMGLPQPSATGSSSDDNLIRALTAYYSARGVEIESDKLPSWPYRKLFQHHASVSMFGNAVAAQLESIPMPEALQNLNINGSFAQQCRNLFDACQMPDILNHRIVSMSYGGWDTHTGQYNRIVGNLNAILGSDGGLATASNELSGAVNDKLVYHLSWDFGRQLAANGANGTDHGRGNYTILIGNPLQGGTYGDLFPMREATPEPGDSQGRTPFEIPGRDINGLTSLEHIWSAHSDWLQPGISGTVFPNAATSPIESAVSFASLYS